MKLGFNGIQKCIQGVRPIISPLDILRKNSAKCWICEGWYEHNFQWDYNKQEVDYNMLDPVFLHLRNEYYYQQS